ncbi:unnamed protein product [Cuscuta epithymum]|uniref:Tetraspanin/Peripherin n=1 Tax=Cuscuta epithymum TaxID=186058 RepID=A0AAV0C046_9ASTE|nr:unnamed protein product [Cuscuta epithymum]
MYNRLSNTVIGFLNLFTLLSSIPIIGAGLWMARRSPTCEKFLQTPLLAIGLVIVVVSLIGFIGACFRVVWAIWLYLVIILLIIGALLAFTIFGFVVTSPHGGVAVPGRLYREYHLENYSPWMRGKVRDPHSWVSIRACILGSKTCASVATSWSSYNFLFRDMSPLQSGCCKPPTSCNYAETTVADCYRWSPDPNLLCYGCDSCKAAVAEEMSKHWKKVSVVIIVVLICLIAIYSLGCCAFRNARRAETDFEYGPNRMSKLRPRWDFHCWRWLHYRRHQLH